MPAPDARTDNYSITEDQLLVGSANGFLNNDSDPDGDPLRIILIDGRPFSFGTPITLASGAKLTINADGSFQYDQNGSFTHLSAGQTVNDIFTYTISDGRGGTDTSAVCMTISGVGGVIQNQPLIITGAISDVVEEEHGLPGGNEDTTDSNGLDTDESGPNTVTNASAGSFVPLITGGIDGTLSFAFAPLGGNPAVQTVSNGPLTSHGKQVYFDTEGLNLIGYYNANGDSSDYDAATDTKVFTMSRGALGTPACRALRSLILMDFPPASRRTSPRMRRGLRREEMAGDTDRIRCLHVGGLVADEKALARLDRPHPHQVEDHAGSGLPPIGNLAVVGDGRVRMVGAIAHIIDPRAFAGQLLSYPGVQIPDVPFGVITMRHAGLVRHHEDEIAPLVEQANGGGRAGHPADAIGGPDVLVVVVDDAIPIEKCGRPSRMHGVIRLQRGHCSLTCGLPPRAEAGKVAQIALPNLIPAIATRRKAASALLFGLELVMAGRLRCGQSDVAPNFYPAAIGVWSSVMPCWAVVAAVRGAKPSVERSAADRRAAA